MPERDDSGCVVRSVIYGIYGGRSRPVSPGENSRTRVADPLASAHNAPVGLVCHVTLIDIVWPVTDPPSIYQGVFPDCICGGESRRTSFFQGDRIRADGQFVLVLR